MLKYTIYVIIFESCMHAYIVFWVVSLIIKSGNYTFGFYQENA
jgi:hypothetical protein